MARELELRFGAPGIRCHRRFVDKSGVREVRTESPSHRLHVEHPDPLPSLIRDALLILKARSPKRTGPAPFPADPPRVPAPSASGAKGTEVELRAQYRTACERAEVEGCRLHALMMSEGRGGPADPAAAAGALAPLCERGDGRSCGILGTLYLHGKGVAPDDLRARRLFEKGCEGDARTCASLAQLVRDGKGGTKDVPSARKHFERACDEGRMGRACAELGLLFERGLGGVKDPARARSLYERALELKDPYGGYFLGAHLRRSAVPEPARSRPLLESACDGAVAKACSELADMLEAGEGGPKDPAAAAELRERACSMGAKDACPEP